MSDLFDARSPVRIVRDDPDHDPTKKKPPPIEVVMAPPAIGAKVAIFDRDAGTEVEWIVEELRTVIDLTPDPNSGAMLGQAVTVAVVVPAPVRAPRPKRKR